MQTPPPDQGSVFAAGSGHILDRVALSCNIQLQRESPDRIIDLRRPIYTEHGKRTTGKKIELIDLYFGNERLSMHTIMQKNTRFSFVETIMIQHAHPAKLTSDILGVIVGWYFLWTHSFVLALIAIFGASVLGTLLVWKKDIVQLYESPLGKWMIGQANPINLIVRSIGFFLLCYGFWSHSAIYFPLGVLIIVIARFVGNKSR